MRIKVTQRHIDKGIPDAGDACPIACALQEAGFQGVHVGEDYARACGKQTYYLPREARMFVARFDAMDPVEPFEFEIPWE